MCGRLNRVVSENMSAGKFITIFYAVLDTDGQKLRYTNAGHIPPILIARDGSVSRLDRGGMVIGIFPDSPYEETEVSFAAAGIGLCCSRMELSKRRTRRTMSSASTA